jgi:hypothetical protein
MLLNCIDLDKILSLYLASQSFDLAQDRFIGGSGLCKKKKVK